jgi:hypothetical protein
MLQYVIATSLLDFCLLLTLDRNTSPNLHLRTRALEQHGNFMKILQMKRPARPLIPYGLLQTVLA